MPFIRQTELDALRSSVARSQGELAQMRIQLADLRQLNADLREQLETTVKDFKAERTANRKQELALIDRQMQSRHLPVVSEKPEKPKVEKPLMLNAAQEAERDYFIQTYGAQEGNQLWQDKLKGVPMPFELDEMRMSG